jgi:transmembrane 9 superfamily protein 2/4
VLQVPLYVSKLTSVKTQMPYEYYTLPYCRPKKFGLQSENLGEALSGDRIENSVYKVCRSSDAKISYLIGFRVINSWRLKFPRHAKLLVSLT